jgi:iron(III) transport system permease protein
MSTARSSVTDRPAWLIVAAFAAAVIGLVVVPVAALAVAALELGPPAFAAALVAALPAVANSTWTALAATVLAVASGTALALLTERSLVPGRRLLRLIVALSLLVPGYVAAIAWLRAYGPAGMLDVTTGVALPGLVGPLGVVLVLAVESMPVAYLFAVAGLALRAEPDTERAARMSGADGLTTLRTITLPLLGPTLAAAAAVCLVLNLTAFGVPAVLGIPDGFTTMTTRIYRDLAFSADPQAFSRAISLALVLALAAAAAIGVADRLGRRPFARSGAATGPLTPAPAPAAAPAPAGGSAHVERVHRRLPPAGLLVGALVCWALVALALLLPLLALLLTALTRAPGLPPGPEYWTLDNFARVLDRHTLAAVVNSGLLSSGAAIGAVGLGGLAVLAGRLRRGGAASVIVALAFAVPGSTLAVAVLLAYGPVLRDSLLIILVAYLAKFWLLGHRPLAAAIASVAADAQRAARVSGATALRAALTITLPLLRPAILAGGLLVFLFGMHEITMSSLLYGPGTATLAVVVLNLQQLGDPTLTAALAVMLTLLLTGVGLPVLSRLRVMEGGAWRR